MNTCLKSNDLYVLKEKIHKCQTLNELKLWFHELCQFLGVENFCCVNYRVDSLQASLVGLLSNYPQLLVESYSDKNQFSVDPSIQYALDSNTPIIWSDLMQREQYSNVRTKQFMVDMQQSGLQQGITIPFRQSFNLVGVVNLACQPKMNIEHLLVKMDHTVHALIARFVDVFLQCVSSNKTINPMQFSSREKECLFWACEGKTTWEISVITGITERTVTFHLNNAGKKLGAMNRQHAVARAILTGVVKPIIA